MDKQKYIFGSLFYISNKLQAIGDQYLAQDDMTTKQWFLTIMLSRFSDHAPTLSEVAERLGNSRQNVKQLALKLQEKGFLKLVKDDQDARAVRLVLTEKNREYWDKRQQKDEHFLIELFSNLSESEMDAIASGYQKIIKKVDHWHD